MADAQQEPDPGQGGANEGPWHPPNQNAAIMAEAAPAIVSRSQNGAAAYVDAGHIPQGYVAVANHFDGANYQDLRPSFSGAYQLNAASQQELFQAAHSTFGRMTPPQHNRFARQNHNDSEAIPAYPGIAADNGAQIITASTVDSSSLQQGYLVLDQDNRVVAVQRVGSPADCTVSQSTIDVGQDGGDGQPSTSLLTMPAMSSGGQYVMQVSMPSFSSQEEVSTSSTDREQSVSSLGAAFQQGGMLGGVRKVEMESTTGECDTTQSDLDCQAHHNVSAARGYLQAVSMAAHSMGMESGGLHSTIMAIARPVTATVTSADLAAANAPMESSQLTSLQNGPLTMAARVESSGGLGRVVDSHAIAEALEAMVSGSGLPASSGVEPQSHRYQAIASGSRDTGEENQPSTSGTVAQNQPSTSGTVAQSRQQRTRPVRKSSRLAHYQQQEEQGNKAIRQHYEPGHYNTQQLWCEDCQTAYEGQCPTHPLSVVPDKVVLSRAWASLPAMLQIFRLGASMEEAAVVDMGVFAKKQIPKMTQFGPFVGELVNSPDEVVNKTFILALERAEGTKGYFETSDENKCNWMMFVRPAATYSEQNMVAYQHGHDIYFTVIKTIEPRHELKVWYAAHYAERLGLKAHELTESDWALMDQRTSRFQCSACSRRFRTPLALQRHLLEHEREETGPEEEKEEAEGEEEGDRRGKRRVGGQGKPQLLKTRNKQNGDAGGGYQWKKKSTSIYINKTLKKYQKRGGSERLRQTIKSLYRRRGRGVGGLQEWVCTHCNLTFDNPSVLNLHTLTHAAEDVGLDEVQKLAGGNSGEAGEPGANGNGASEFAGEEISQMVRLVEGDNNTVTLETCLVCPMCHVQFDDKRALIEHAAEHAKAPRPDRPFKCHMCWKAFQSKEKLQKHLLCHGEEESKPLACEFCNKRFMNNSALACHLKTHSEKKYYQCPLCNEGYDHISALKEHVTQHADANGHFTCDYCNKSFEDYHCIRKHMKSFHSDKQYTCNQCNRVFSRPDKLKLHMLRHTSHREFMCETCGRQFKRKDKLKEHIKRMHAGDKEPRVVTRPHKESSKKFIPRVAPSEYQRFIYKCHTCMLGFKRRGMLVNHLNKRHPNVKPESVHELSLPILKQQRDYFCQHCDKVYKSSSKRKAHILKNHPGAELPASSRKKPLEQIPTPGLVNQTFSQTTGSITTMPHGCEFCHKQYASKAKLMQHQRKLHPDLVPAAQERRKSGVDSKGDLNIMDITVTEDGAAVPIERYEDIIVAAPNANGDIPQADLLTQAMTELISSHDFRPGSNITVHTPDTIQLSRFVTGAGPTLLQVQPNGTLQPATIELSQLTQALSAHPHFAAHTAQLAPGTTLIAAASNPQQQQMLSAQPVNISMVTTNGGQAIPVSIQTNQAFVPRTWASTIQTFQR
ncbi:PR domain zinc finger protein 10-like isoform X2 [Littorina saxatilis]|uniref:PR domain zinc finger protein 10-like isoform X2 n=1 Tax=Littorina saxatilis TaxID=31220 RepID=UPI0038B4B141